MGQTINISVDLRTDSSEVPSIDGAYTHATVVEEAAHHMGKSFPGGMAGLAAKAGMNPVTLSMKLNPAQHSHRLSLAEAVHISKVAGSSAIAQAFCNEVGGIFIQRAPAPSDDMLVLMSECVYALGNLQWRVAQMQQRDGLRAVSKNEMRSAEHSAEDLITAVQHVLAGLRARIPAAPSVGF